MNDDNLLLVLKALADPTRFRMVQAIAAAEELTCGALVDSCGLSQPTVSHHLKILVDAGVLLMRTEGKHHCLSVDQALVAAASAALPGRLGPARMRKKPRVASRR